MIRNVLIGCMLSAVACLTGCGGLQWAEVRHEAKLNVSGQVRTVYVVDSYWNEGLGGFHTTLHESPPDTENLKQAAKEVRRARSLTALGWATAELDKTLSESEGRPVRVVLLSFDPPVFGYYPKDEEAPIAEHGARSSTLATDHVLDQRLHGYVVGDARLIVDGKKGDAAGHIERNVRLDTPTTVRQLLVDAPWLAK